MPPAEADDASARVSGCTCTCRGGHRRVGWYTPVAHVLNRGAEYVQREYKRTGGPAQDGLAQVDCSGRRSGALLRGSGAHHLRGQPQGLFGCGSIILSSQTVDVRHNMDNSRRLGRLSPSQSGPRMWSSTLQRSVRLAKRRGAWSPWKRAAGRGSACGPPPCGGRCALAVRCGAGSTVPTLNGTLPAATRR